MGKVRHINIPLTTEQFELALEIKNGKSWEDFLMNYVNSEKEKQNSDLEKEDHD